MPAHAPALIRPAAPTDADVIAEVYLASRKTFLLYAPLAHSDADVRGWVRDHLLRTADVRVALRGGAVVGMLALTRDDAGGWIDQLYLHPGAVGQGIGAEFVEQAKAALGAPIRLYTFQANAGARRFYERHGFRAIALGDGAGNEERCPDVLYEWP
jgi:GNAT superfamily N-acetyltransferase